MDLTEIIYRNNLCVQKVHETDQRSCPKAGIGISRVEFKFSQMVIFIPVIHTNYQELQMKM
jgi:hypothetical protein